MIFKQQLVDQILAGNKTQTRRPVKFDPVLRKESDCRYKVGRTYAVQPGRGERAVARIEVTGTRRERWIDITEADAIAEGFRDGEVLRRDHPSGRDRVEWRPALQAFFDYLYELYRDFNPKGECWVIEFELLAAAGKDGEQ